MKLTKQEILKLAASIMYWGLLIDLLGAGLLFVLGHLVRNSGIMEPIPPEKLKGLAYFLVGISALEVMTIVVLKRRWITSRSPQLSIIRNRDVLSRQLKILFVILYLVALTPSIYGFLYYILGGAEELFTTMLAITLVGYMLTRVRPDGLEKAVGEFDLEDPG